MAPAAILPRRGPALCALAAACLATVPGAGVAALRIEPTLGLTQTFTDNADLSTTQRRSEGITQISPGVRLSSAGGRLSGELAYTVNGLVYARRSEDNTVQHALSSGARLVAIDNHLFVSASAGLTQQAVSAFDATAPDLRLASRNRRQVGTASVSPVLTGRLFGEVDASVSGTVVRTRVRDSVVGDSGTENLTLSLSSGRGPLGWGLSAGWRHAEFAGGVGSESQFASGSLSWRPDVDWRLTGRAGWEADNGLGGGNRSSTTYGASAAWSPSPRTNVDVNVDERVFGRTWSVSAQHRFRRSSVRFSDTRSVSEGLGVTTGRVTSAYDLLFEQFASIEPDPVRRDLLVRSFLADSGLDPNAGLVVGGGFLAASRTLDHRQDLALSLTGVRTTVTTSLSRTESRRLGVAAVGDDLARVGRVRQHTYTLNLSHRLTADVSAVLSATGVKTLAEGAQPGTSYRLVSAATSLRLGPRVSVSLTLRHVNGDRPGGAYTENAATAVFGLRF